MKKCHREIENLRKAEKLNILIKISTRGPYQCGNKFN